METQVKSSNHLQEIVNILVTRRDNDTILLKVNQEGVVCHTGRKSCFFTDLNTNVTIWDVQIDTSSAYGVIDTLYHTILEKRMMIQANLYTAKLFKANKIQCLKNCWRIRWIYFCYTKIMILKKSFYEAVDITSCFSCTLHQKHKSR